MQVDINGLAIPNLSLVFGLVGTAFSVLMMVFSKKFFVSDTHEESEMKLVSIKETLIHNAQETAFVGTWVLAGLPAYELFVLLLAPAAMPWGNDHHAIFVPNRAAGSTCWGIGGIIPGCGPQIIFVTLFTKGLVPFSAAWLTPFPRTETPCSH